MALKAASNCILVAPSGDNDETERGRIIVVQNDDPQHKILRGVVLHVGSNVHGDVAAGDLAHYTSYHEIGDKHVVPAQYLLAFEDDE